MRLAWLLLVLCAASVSASAFTSLMDVLSSSFKYAYVPEYHAFSSHSIFLINTSHLMQMDGSHLRHNRRDSHCDVRAGRYRLSAHVASDVQYSGGASQSYSAGGTIPAEISLLGATLTTLRISGYPGLNAGLIGGIPSQLSFLSGLKTLSFGNNRLNGTIPAELGYLTEIAILDLSDNQLTGAVPGSLTALSALLQVDLSGNFLGGPLSAALALFTATVSIRLDNNAFTGPIPTQLPSASTLLTLEISTNPLSGGLPTQLLGTLTALKELYASACGLSGVIPTEILITGINILDLSNNTFTSFPPELLSRTMSTLNLNNNQFSGPLPTQVGSPGATSLSLAGNFFTGPIPPFTSSKQIKIDLSNNPLATTLPDWSNFTTTVIGSELRLRNCGLVGPLPPFSPYTKWAVIDLAFNSLYGSLAPFSALTGANTIDVENNYLTGTFPSALANNLNLIQLNVGSNLLSGTVPSSFAAFPLSSLILRDNNFTGPYPTTFSSSILLLVGVADFTLNDFDNCSKASPSPLILLSCRAVPIGTPPPPLPPTTAPVATTPAATTPAVTTVPAATTLAPSTLPVTTAPGCQLPPPFDLAECIGGVWIVNDTSGGVGPIVVGGTPVVVVGDLVLTNSSVVLVTPGGVLNITGTIVLGGVIVIAFPASQPPQDGEFVPVLNAGNVTGAVVRVELQYTRDCGDATGTPQTTETSFGVLISVKGCGHRRTAIIAGSVIGGVILLTALIVAAFLVARKMGWGRTLFQQREARNQSYLY